MTRCVLGIDGGGTRTRAVLLSDAGKELARSEGGPALVGPGSATSGVVEALREAALAAIVAAGVRIPVAAIHAGLAGAGREGARSEIEGALRRAFGEEAPAADRITERLNVGTDVESAFQAAFGRGAGILVISGTGSIAWGRAENGRTARTGGWGSLLGDEGSGFRIGLEALRAAVRSADGRGERTELEGMILEMLGLDSAERLVDWAGAATKRNIALLAPLVHATARTGDAAAGRIIERANAELERHVVVLLETLGPWSSPPGVALSGGLLSADGILRKALLEALAAHGCVPLATPVDAPLGAARLALEAISAPIPEP